MKAFFSAVFACASLAALAQSGTPSPAGQTITAQGEASADAAVKRRHDNRLAKKAAKAASKRASAASS